MANTIQVFSFDFDGTLTSGGNCWDILLRTLDCFQPDIVEKWYSGGYECYEDWLHDTCKPLIGRPKSEFDSVAPHACKFLRPGMAEALLKLKQQRPEAHILVVSGGLIGLILPAIEILEAEAAKLAGPAGVPGGSLVTEVIANDFLFDENDRCCGFNSIFLEKDEVIPGWCAARGLDASLHALHIGDAFNDVCALACTAGGVCMPCGNPLLQKYSHIVLPDEEPEKVPTRMIEALLATASDYENGKRVKDPNCPRRPEKNQRGTA